MFYIIQAIFKLNPWVQLVWRHSFTDMELATLRLAQSGKLGRPQVWPHVYIGAEDRARVVWCSSDWPGRRGGRGWIAYMGELKESACGRQLESWRWALWGYSAVGIPTDSGHTDHKAYWWRFPQIFNPAFGEYHVFTGPVGYWDDC